MKFRSHNASRMLGREEQAPAAPEEGEAEAEPASAVDAEEPAREAPPAGHEPDRALHVAMDVRFWNMSGLGTFQRELLGAFARLGLPLRFTCIGPARLREQLPSQLLLEHWIDFDAEVYSTRSLLGYPRIDADVFHYPHYNLPLARARRRVVNVFDLFHLKYGNLARRAYMRTLLRRLRWAGRGTRFVTAAEKVSRELAQLGGVAPERIRRIYPGPGRGLAAARPARAEVKSIAGQPLRAPWLLATGIDQPHKNFDFLLSALSLYYQRRPEAPPLVWAGLSPEAIAARTRQLPANARQKVALEPYSTPERMEQLMAGAAGLVFPSLDEGFGFPPLEAMARGIPVICARREPMTRLLGNAPFWFEPAESASLWRMIDRLLDNPPLRDEQIQAGFEAAKCFGWERCAQQYFELYQELVMPAR